MTSPEQYERTNRNYWYPRTNCTVDEVFDWLDLKGNESKFFGFHKETDKLNIFSIYTKGVRKKVTTGKIQLLKRKNKLMIVQFLKSNGIYISIGCKPEDRHKARSYLRFRSIPKDLEEEGE